MSDRKMREEKCRLQTDFDVVQIVVNRAIGNACEATSNAISSLERTD
jgi:hypothetical protein